MVQNKLPLINSAHGSETRNIINELIKLFNGMGYTYDQALHKAHNVLNEAKKTNDMNKDVQQQVDDLIIHAGESDAEVIQARGDAPLLKDRLDKTDTGQESLTNAFKSVENANAKDELNLVNYVGNKQNIHPKVLVFDNNWKGFKYWMAYTPYPNGNTDLENPCIAVSNDKVNWDVPNGLINPLDPTPSTGYNSDTHLLYRQDLDRLEIWWRYADTPNGKTTLYRRTSKDGVTWTAKEAFFANTGIGTADTLSPSIIFEDGIYKMWYIPNTSNKYIAYKESTTASALNWTEPERIPFDWGDLSPWHMDVVKTDLGYEMITTAYAVGGNNNTADLYYHRINNDGTLEHPKLILQKSNNPTALDHRGIYRSSLLKEKDNYFLFYSSIDGKGRRRMSLSYGKDVSGLTGYSFNDEKTANTKRVSPGSILDVYDVSDTDVILVGSGAAVEVISLTGGYIGKEVTFILTGSTAKINLKQNDRLQMPQMKDYLFSADKGFILKLICYEPNGNRWRPDIQIPEDYKGWLHVGAGYDFSSIDINGIETFGVSYFYEITSLPNGFVGQKIDFITTNSSATVTFKHNSNLSLPNNQDLVLDNNIKGVSAYYVGSSRWVVVA